jgi:predicted ATPase
MEVTKVHFEAFKSLYNVTCDLNHLTVITGANGSGKSNLVEALHFLGEVYRHGLEFAISRAGGYDNIAHRRTRRAKHPITVMVELLITPEDIRETFPGLLSDSESAENVTGFPVVYRHTFSIKTAGQSLVSDYTVQEDRVEILSDRGAPLITLTGGLGQPLQVETSRRLKRDSALSRLMQPFLDKRYQELSADRPLANTALLTDASYGPPLLFVIKEGLAGTNIFQLSPFQCRATGVSTPNAELERHGENLPGAADHLRRNDAAGWQRVQSAMHSILPDLLGIEIVHTEDRRLALQFRERGLGRPWNTGEVSDGTIQALALFLALYDIRNPLLVVEEPENSIHPWILRQFLDLVREAPNKQIILTTHSPVLLNYVDPKLVRLMSMSNGRSSIVPLLDASAEVHSLVVSGELSLFDAYDSGVLRETIPLGYSSTQSSDEP